MHVQPIVIEDYRLRLEPLELRHAADWLKVGTPDVMAYTFQPQSYTLEGFQKLIATLLAETHRCPFIIYLRANGEPIGYTGYLNIDAKNRGLEIGTWLGRAYQGRGINTEAKFLLLRHAFEVLGALRVQFKTDHRNIQSQRALEKIGAVREGVLRHHRLNADGSISDSVIYSIIAPEWPAVKTLLTARLGVGEENL